MRVRVEGVKEAEVAPAGDEAELEVEAAHRRQSGGGGLRLRFGGDLCVLLGTGRNNAQRPGCREREEDPRGHLHLYSIGCASPTKNSVSPKQDEGTNLCCAYLRRTRLPKVLFTWVAIGSLLVLK